MSPAAADRASACSAPAPVVAVPAVVAGVVVAVDAEEAVCFVPPHPATATLATTARIGTARSFTPPVFRQEAEHGLNESRGVSRKRTRNSRGTRAGADSRRGNKNPA